MNTVPAYHNPAFPAYFPEELVNRANTMILKRGESLFSQGERIDSPFRVIACSG